MYCKNCSALLNSNQSYCAECGAKRIKNRLTIKNLSKDVGEQFFSYDNKLIITFKELFSKPEAVINGYIDGTRKKHINVIQYFAISLTLVGIQIYLVNSFFSEAMEMDMNAFDDFIKTNDSPNAKIIVQSYIDSLSFLQNYQNIVYIIGVPIGAFSTWAAYNITSNKRFNFTEHIVINLYYSAQLIIVLFIISLLFILLRIHPAALYGIVILFSMAYFFYIFKRVYFMSFWQTFANMLLTSIIYSILFTLLFGSAVIGLILYRT